MKAKDYDKYAKKEEENQKIVEWIDKAFEDKFALIRLWKHELNDLHDDIVDLIYSL